MESGSSVALAMGEKRKGREEEEAVVGFNHLPVHRFYYTSGGGSGDFYEEAKVWQPYNSSSTPYEASVVPMRVFPFTSAQWQELQRQALIYKHIMASVPVPPDLLLPISARAFPEAPPLLIQPTMVGGENGVARFNLRFSTNSTDPEPGRCRRTDGKKWRCSRDAAPDQKYCERHMHRGRPRSRKPVELRNNKNNNSNSNSKSAASATDVDTAMTATASVTVNPSNTSQATGLLTKVDLKLPFQSMESTNDTRYLDNLASNQQWMQPHYEDLPNLNYTDLNDQSCPFLNPDLSVLEQNAAGNNETPRSFIDAWSTEYASATATTNPAEAMPTLTLSMSNNADAIEGEIQMGLGLGVKSMKWTGGPLAEALQSTSNMTSTSGSSKSTCVDLINLMCKSCCGSQEVSPRDSPTRVASSPSRVLHKLPVSMSDSSSSSNNSFQWMNHHPK